MGKKRKFNRFINWMRSDLPDDKSSVVLLGVAKLSSPIITDARKSHKRGVANTPSDYLNNYRNSINSINSNDIIITGQKPSNRKSEIVEEEKFTYDLFKNEPVNSISSTWTGLDPACFIRNDLPRKSVSFSKDTEELLASREQALANRELLYELYRNENGANSRVFDELINPRSDYRRISINSVKESIAEVDEFEKNETELIDGQSDKDDEYVEFNRRRRSTETESNLKLLRNKLVDNRPVNDHNLTDDNLDRKVFNLYRRYSNQSTTSNISSNSNDSNPSRTHRKASIYVEANDLNDILNDISDELNVGGDNNNRKSPKIVDSFEKVVCNGRETDDLNVNSDWNKSTNHKYYKSDVVIGSARGQYTRKLNTGVDVEENNNIPGNRSSQTNGAGRKSSIIVQPNDVDQILNEISGDLIQPQRKLSQSNLPNQFRNNSIQSNASFYNGTRRKSSISIETSDYDQILTDITDALNIGPNVRRLSLNSVNSTPKHLELFGRLLNMDKSVDSIGSCSLDVDISNDISDRSKRGSITSLKSASILTPSHPVVSSTQSTVNPPVINIIDESPVNASLNESPEAHKPSYLNLSCCVSGYSNLTNYDSKLRESYRSGENRSRDISPIRPLSSIENCSGLRDHSVLGNAQSSLEEKLSSLNETMDEQRYSFQMKESAQYYMSSTVTTKTTTNDTVDFCRNTFTSANNTTNGKDAITTTPKSFIQQRIERLYGPGQLAQGYLSPIRRTLTTETKENKIELSHDTKSPSLPVLRHLRPEFRAQLPILSPRSKFETSKTANSEITNRVGNVDVAKQFNDDHVNGVDGVKKDVLSASNQKDDMPAAPLVILPNTIKSVNENGSNGLHDGRYYLNLHKIEAGKLILLAESAEAEMNDSVLSEEALGCLRTAAGKARLLVSQKMQQFEGLCYKNINQNANEPFPTKIEDLEGYWDMVMLQINDVHNMFNDLNAMRLNGWKEIHSLNQNGSQRKVIGRGVNKITSSATPRKSSGEITPAKKTDAQLKREMERKRMLESRRKAMATSKRENDSVEIFVADKSS